MAALIVVGSAAIPGQASADLPPLTGDYRFQDSRESSVAGGPAIADAGAGNAFSTETVGCHPARVLTFPKDSGVQLGTGALVSTNHYSLDVLFRLADTSGYKRIFAPGSGGAYAADSGLYVHSGLLDFYDTALPLPDVLGPAPALFDNAYAEVAFSYFSFEQTAAYVNGIRQLSYESTLTAQATLMRFFKDNDTGGTTGEDSAGAVARIRLYSGTLSAAQVTAIYRAGPLGDRCRRATVTVKRKVKVRRARYRRLLVLTGIDATCPPGGSRCVGVAAVDPSKGSRHSAALSRRGVHLGRVSLSVAPARTKHVRVRLSRRASKSLKRAGKLRAQIVVRLTPPGGFSGRAERNVTIRAPGRAGARR